MNQNDVIEYLKGFEKEGMYLHADEEHMKNTVNSLIENHKRYGQLTCPCRLATGEIEDDKDIVCPCEYAKADVEEFGACFCILLVRDIFKDSPEFFPDIDDRRPPEKVK